jgi:dolichol-phosphate mannosyltransferase
MSPPTLSIVLPVFNEEATIPQLDRRLREMLQGLAVTWEVVFIDDGSSAKSRELLRELAGKEPRYKLVAFSRNFGHQMAITAGIDKAEGDAVVIMDADLQDPPEVIAQMLERWREGYDVVYAVRNRRHGETLFKKASAAIFYRILRVMTGFDIPVDVGDFRLMGRSVVMTLRALRERHRFLRGMVAWVGFRQTAVYYERSSRFAGETKFSMRTMVKFAPDEITSFSVVPLKLATWFGLGAGLIAVGAAVWALWEKLSGGFVVQGWTTIMILVALGSSVQLLVTGILGEYVGRIYEEVKRRPLYAVAEELNLPARDDSVGRRPPPPWSDPARGGGVPRSHNM